MAKLKIVLSCVDVSIEVYYYKVWPNDVYIYIICIHIYIHMFTHIVSILLQSQNENSLVE